MKYIRQALSLLLCLLMLMASLTACHTPQDGPDDTDPPEKESTSEDNTEDNTKTPSNENGDQTENGPVSGDLSPDEDTPDEDDVNAIRYGYYPTISAVMPTIHINTPNGDNSWATKYNQTSKNDGLIQYVDATVTVTGDEDYELTDAVAQVKVRGNATLTYPKKPLRIKFQEKQGMLGLHDGEKYKNWVLLADWKDLSMSNNTAAFYLGNAILGSDGYYCTDFRNVEVYLDGDYWGVYLLVEQQETKSNRTSVPDVPDGYTGTDIGYFFEFDGYYTKEKDIPNGDPTFEMLYGSDRNKGYTLKSDINDPVQLQFLKNYMDRLYEIADRAINEGAYYQFNEDYTALRSFGSCKSAKEAVGQVIDLQSLVDIYILNEIACDADVDWSSFYLSLNMTATGNKKLTFEAPWDFDSSFGMVPGNCNDALGLYAAGSTNPWFALVAECDWFWDMVKEKWAELKEYGVLDNVLKVIREEKETYRPYYANNYTRWSERVEKGNWQCMDILNTYKDPKTAQGLASDYLTDWLTKRIAYLDTQWTTDRPEDKVPDGSTTYRFEAEEAALSGFQHANPIDMTRPSASNNGLVGFLRTGSTITFTVSAEQQTDAYLYLGISKYDVAGEFSSWFHITVNGQSVPIPLRRIPAVSAGEQSYYTFISVPLAAVSLKAGENVIAVTAVKNTTNVDYLDVAAPVKITKAQGDAPPAGATAYRFEVEDAVLSNFQSAEPIRTEKSYASGKSYVGDVRANSTMTFTVNAAEAGEAYIYVGVSKLSSSFNFSTTFTVKLNGETLSIPTRTVSQVSGNEEAYHTFVAVPTTKVNLKKGENVIQLVAVSNATNVDYIDVHATSKVTWAS